MCRNTNILQSRREQDAADMSSRYNQDCPTLHKFITDVRFKHQFNSSEWTRGKAQIARRELHDLLEKKGGTLSDVPTIRNMISLCELGKWTEMRSRNTDKINSEYDTITNMKDADTAATISSLGNKSTRTQKWEINANDIAQNKEKSVQQTGIEDEKQKVEQGVNGRNLRETHNNDTSQRSTGQQIQERHQAGQYVDGRQQRDNQDNERLHKNHENNGKPHNNRHQLGPPETDKQQSRLELSKSLSEALRKDNPSITDLSDENRPMKLAERFGELYDNDWTDALEDVQKRGHHQSEKECIAYLESILQETYKLTKTKANEELDSIIKNLQSGQEKAKDEAIKILKEKGPSTSKEVLKKVKTAFGRRDINSESKLDAFMDKCTELTWLMVIHDPPLHLHWCKPGETMDTNMFKEYTKRGSHVDFSVWPALKLYNNGPLLRKGVAQPK